MYRLVLRCAAALVFLTMVGSCGNRTNNEQAAACADSFAINYFNWNFNGAARFCTPESVRWLQFAASQVTLADIDTLRVKAHGADVEITDMTMNSDESQADISLTVTDFMTPAAIGHGAEAMARQTFKLAAVRVGDGWKIKMEDLPRSER